VALADQFEKFAEEFGDKPRVFVLANDGDVRAAVDDPDLLGVLQVLPKFAVLTEELEGFLLVF